MTWHDDFGKEAELYICGELQERSLNVVHIGSTYEYDLLINGNIRAEVKAAIPTGASGNRSQRWQFSFGRHNKLNDEELVFLVCYDNDLAIQGVFVIPGCDVGPRLKKIDITSSLDKYHGKWAKYLGKWNVVEDIVAVYTSKTRLEREAAPEEEIPF